MLVKLLLSIILWGTFTLVVLKVDYPENITSANFLQLSSFFISLLLALTFTINIFLNFSSSFSIVLGLMILLALKALDSLNIVSAALTIIAILLILSYFKKARRVIRGIRRIRGIRKRNRV